jgi:hypothetical protein
LENKTVIIEQALFGQVGVSHDCIFSTIADPILNAELNAFTDKPSNTNGAIVGTYYSAAVITSYFVFAKTMPDSAASRSGMVFTHALIVSVNDVPKINDLNSLFNLFTLKPSDRNEKLKQIDLNVKPTNQLSQNISPKYVVQTIRNIISGLKVEYFGDVEQFLQLMAVVWNGLPPLLRRNLTFGIGFSVTDIERKAVTALYFRPELSARVNSHNPIFQTDNEKITVTDSVELLILGNWTENEFNSFLNSFNIIVTDLNFLGTANRAYQIYKDLKKATPDELRQLVRLLVKLSPVAQNGITEKDRIIDCIAEMISAGKDYNIKALRNIELQAFPNADLKLSEVVQSFITAQFTDQLNFASENICELVELCESKAADSWWFTSVKKGLLLSFSNTTTFKNIWRLLALANLKPDMIFPYFSTTTPNEELLLADLPPTLAKPNALALKPFFLQRKWFRLYANTSLFYLTPVAALTDQLVVEKGKEVDRSAGVRLIAVKINDTELLAVTLTGSDVRLLTLLNERLQADQTILAQLDTNVPKWLAIWAINVETTGKLWAGIENVEEKAGDLIQLIVQSIVVPEILVENLSATQYANLTLVTNREPFWQNVPPAYRNLFLNATANGYADMLAAGHQFQTLPEQVLSSHLTSDGFVTSYLSKHRANLDAVIALYHHLGIIKDEYLAGYIHHFPGSISDFSSAQLGTLIQTSNFQKSAKSVFEKSKYNNSFKIALTQCKSLVKLSIWDKIFHGGLFGITVDQNVVYEALFDFSKENYKRGPEDNDIWKRAGGDISKLKNDATREENWRHAIHLLRNGGAGKNINIKSLLKEMRKDYSQSGELQELLKYFN